MTIQELVLQHGSERAVIQRCLWGQLSPAEMRAVSGYFSSAQLQTYAAMEVVEAINAIGLKLTILTEALYDHGRNTHP